MRKHILSKRTISFLLLMAFVLSTVFTAFVSAGPAVTINANDGYVKVFTTQGKPIWVKIALPGGGTDVTLKKGDTINFRLDYVFDDTYKPAAGDSLLLYVSGFPASNFIMPKNDHTSGNSFSGDSSDGIITIRFANNPSNPLNEGTRGWLNITFTVTADVTDNTVYNPKITGGTAENIFTVGTIIVPKPPEPGNPGTGEPPPAGSSYDGEIKRVGTAYYFDENENYAIVRASSNGVLAFVPDYVKYQVFINWGTDDRRIEYDSVTISDTLGDGISYVLKHGDPWENEYVNSGVPPFSMIRWADHGWQIALENPYPAGHERYAQYEKCVNYNKANNLVDYTITDKTFTLTIKPGAYLVNVLGGPKNDIVGENYWTNGIRELPKAAAFTIEYITEITDTELTEYKNKLETIYATKDGIETTEKNHDFKVELSGGAQGVKKLVGKENETPAVHKATNPLTVDVGDIIKYQIVYTVTGDEDVNTTQIGAIMLDDILPAGVKYKGGVTGDFDITETSENKLVLKNNKSFNSNQTYKVQFLAQVTDELKPGETAVNTVRGSDAVIKRDGYAVIVYKYDENDANKKPLANVKFELKYNDNGIYKSYDPAVTLTTIANGYTPVKYLPVGKYKLIETEVPDGYKVNEGMEIEFEILAETARIKGIDRLSIIKLPDGMTPPFEDNAGVAVFKVPNQQGNEPMGKIAVVKNIDNGEIGVNKFYVNLTSDDGFLKFKTVDNKYVYDPDDGTITDIEINNTIGVILHDIPLSLGKIKVIETLASRTGYNVTYTIGANTSSENSNYAEVTLLENNETVAVTVTNKRPPAGEITISGQKKVKGINGASPAGFKFKLTEVENYGLIPAGSLTAVSDATGLFTFKKLTGLKKGEYLFKIEEIVDNPMAGWKYTEPKILKVTVSELEDGTGTLTNTTEWLAEDMATSANAVFTNYDLTVPKIEIAKTVEGKPITDWALNGGGFTDNGDINELLNSMTFELYAVTEDGGEITGMPVATAKINGEGKIVFEKKDPAEYFYGWYAVKETLSGLSEKIFAQVEPQYIYISSDETGSLSFDNKPADLPYTIDGVKNVAGQVGASLAGYEFKLTEVGNYGLIPAEFIAVSKNDGKFSFDEITIKTPGTYEFLIEESGKEPAGWIYAPPKKLTLDVTRVKGEWVVAETWSGDNTNVFTNTYKTGTADVTITGKKAIAGIENTNKQFTFLLAQITGEGEPEINAPYKASTQITGAGNFVFELKNLEVGTYYYEIKEEDESGEGWTYSNNVMLVEVVVADNSDGTAVATTKIISGNGTDIFTNKYSVRKTSWIPAATKILTGGLEKFNFGLFEADENGEITGSAIGTKQNELSGASTITFDEIEYNAPGEHYYVLKETSQSGNGWTVDDTQYLIKVVVSDNGNGTLTAEAFSSANYTVPVTDKTLTFTNTYSATGNLTLTGTKTVSFGSGIEEFNFTVAENGKTVTKGTNDKDGAITFEPINYTLGDVGRHEYVISEDEPLPEGWLKDSSPVTIYVEVADNKDGTLTAAAYSDKDYTVPVTATTLTFANKYNTSALVIKKVLNGDYYNWGVNGDTEFTAKLKISDGVYLTFDKDNIYTGTNATGTAVKFSVNNPAVLTGIPVGTVCTAEEESGNYTTGYNVNSMAINDGGANEITITNSYIFNVGSMIIQKELAGSYSDWDADETKVFYARIKDNFNNILMFEQTGDGSYSYSYVGNIELIPFSVRNYATINNLPMNGSADKYTVEEVLENGDPIPSDVYTAAIVYSGGGIADIAVTVTNTYEPMPMPGTLTIKKTELEADGTSPIKDREFEFTLEKKVGGQLMPVSLRQFNNANIAFTGPGKVDSAAGGQAGKFILTNGAEAAITGLSAGEYVITETITNTVYKTTVSADGSVTAGSAAGFTMAVNQDKTIEFTNQKATVLEIKKTITYVGSPVAMEVGSVGIGEPATEPETEEPTEPLTENTPETTSENENGEEMGEFELDDVSERIPLNGIFMPATETFTFVLLDSQGSPVDLSRFDVRSDRGNPMLTDGGGNGRFELVENETITIYGLDFAEYTLKEVEIGGNYYTEYPDDSVYFRVTNSTRIEFNNIEELPPPPMAEVTILKDFVNSGGIPNDGREFTVRLTSDLDDEYIFTLSEDNGWEDTKEVPPGMYLIQEDYADGYDNVSITSNGVAGNLIRVNDLDVITVVVTNKKIIPPEPVSADIWIEKRIEMTGIQVRIPDFDFMLRELNTNTVDDFKEGAQVIYPNEQINRAGRFFFTVSGLSEGIYYYQINERDNAPNLYWSYDAAPRIVTVTVDNNMNISMGWSEGSPIFTNRYVYIPPVTDSETTPTPPASEPTTPAPQPTTPAPEPTTIPEEAGSDEPATVPESTTVGSITATEPESGNGGGVQEEPATIPATTVFDDKIYLQPNPPTEPAAIISTTSAAPLVAVGDFEFYETIPDFATPLANGWFAADLGDDLYEIFDENGTPLGFVRFDGNIGEWESFDEMIPLATFLWGEEDTTEAEIVTLPTEPETEVQAPKPTPQTGDGLNVIFAMLGLMILGAVTGIAILRRKTGVR